MDIGLIFPNQRTTIKTDAGTQEDSAAVEMESRGGYMRAVGSEVRPHKAECSQE